MGKADARLLNEASVYRGKKTSKISSFPRPSSKYFAKNMSRVSKNWFVLVTTHVTIHRTTTENQLSQHGSLWGNTPAVQPSSSSWSILPLPQIQGRFRPGNLELQICISISDYPILVSCFRSSKQRQWVSIVLSTSMVSNGIQPMHEQKRLVSCKHGSYLNKNLNWKWQNWRIKCYREKYENITAEAKETRNSN